jgi:hypothetical protein
VLSGAAYPEFVAPVRFDGKADPVKDCFRFRYVCRW